VNDIGPGYLLRDLVTGAITGVTDFGDIAVGDPARDFIFIYEDLTLTVIALAALCPAVEGRILRLRARRARRSIRGFDSRPRRLKSQSPT
jgi:aminoglycoside phosphotransferase (APT) family kinase protein